jgi:hypothetical protein
MLSFLGLQIWLRCAEALLLLSEARVDDMRASPSSRLASGSMSGVFHRRRPPEGFVEAAAITNTLIDRRDVPASGYLLTDSLTAECTVTVLKEPKDTVVIFPSTHYSLF